MIKSIRSPESLQPKEVITDALFDALRYGDSKRARWVNSFGSAAKLRQACATLESRRGTNDQLHPLVRLLRAYENREAKQLREAASRGAADEWALPVQKAESTQRARLETSRRNRRRYL